MTGRTVKLTIPYINTYTFNGETTGEAECEIKVLNGRTTMLGSLKNAKQGPTSAGP